MRQKPRFALLVTLILTAFLLAFIAVNLALKTQKPSISPPGQVISTGQARIGGTFTLQDDEGNAVTEQSLIGKNYTLLFFGFTNCPDVCPAMLQMMADVLQKLPPEIQSKINMIFVSVDPARDDTRTLKAYVDGFDPRFVGWTGTKEQVDEVTKKYLAYYAARTPQNAEKPDEYQVDHSAFLYLINPQGQYVTHFPNTTAQDVLLTKLTELTK
jgi:protein SCO1/2